MSVDFASWNPYGEVYEDDNEPLTLYHPVGWWLFHWAAERIKKTLGTSMGTANVRLRQLCASGEVRSIRYDHSDVDDVAETSESEEEFEGRASEIPEHIKPAEWRADPELDLSRTAYIMICVSEEDVKHWIKAQGPKEEETGGGPSHKRDLASQAVAALYPQGVPKSLGNKDIERAVAERMKADGVTPPHRDTILRAAGRK